MDKSDTIMKEFGINVFSDAVMKERLSEETYREFRATISEGRHMSQKVADEVADAMCRWAVENGATHYTHWFQPLTGFTAEKHDSFIAPDGMGGAIYEFSGSELIRGEPDASSFPSGGIRATFEARGYTAWDCTSPAFLKRDKNGVTALCIPTAFCSYTGEALDSKTPLLRSCEALNKQALRVLKLMGVSDATHVSASVGAEQEYFLIKKSDYAKRKDLIYTGRTLFGARPPKGQELSDQYYGVIRPVVSEFMDDLNQELWRDGIFAKTQHNEAAPAQHELAPIYCGVNAAADQNQLIMEIMRKVADRHGLVCLLHEKPFAGVNGSGKHNNWSIVTDTGINLLSPGKDPGSNLLFLMFFTSVIAAVDRYAGLLRMSCASAGNDQRLGGYEAPPAIISIFIGEPLERMLYEIESGEAVEKSSSGRMNIGVSTMPLLRIDNTDRNRTSPFAFTGNKFEFRMLGASQSIATPNTVLNTAVAEILSEAADKIESSDDVESAILDVIKMNISKHKRILFCGNNYTDEWRLEAKRRGLPIFNSSIEAVEEMDMPYSTELFTRHQVFTETELHSRVEIGRTNYIQTVRIEAYTMLEMARREVLPAGIRALERLARTGDHMRAAGGTSMALNDLLAGTQETLDRVLLCTERLSEIMNGTAPYKGDSAQLSRYYQGVVLPAMRELRTAADKLEVLVPRELWTMPTYGEMLYYV